MYQITLVWKEMTVISPWFEENSRHVVIGAPGNTQLKGSDNPDYIQVIAYHFQDKRSASRVIEAAPWVHIDSEMDKPVLQTRGIMATLWGPRL